MNIEQADWGDKTEPESEKGSRRKDPLFESQEAAEAHAEEHDREVGDCVRKRQRWTDRVKNNNIVAKHRWIDNVNSKQHT